MLLSRQQCGRRLPQFSYLKKITSELCTVEVDDALGTLRAQAIRPRELICVRVFTPHHASKLGLGVIVLGLLGALFRWLLRFSAGAVATPSAENDVPYHHPVVRRIDV